MKEETHAGRQLRDHELYGGLVRLHVLYHADKEPIFGLGIIEELRRHGYHLSAGTLYPISLGFVEGLNDEIRVVQRRTCGLRDEEYLRLKILTCMLPAL